MTRSGESETLGIYVHVPFCERVCPYCDFAVEGVGRLDPAVASSYVDHVLAELALSLKVRERDLADRPLETVYLGGGTPSLLPPDEVERLLAALREHFPGSPEVTLELNPGIAEALRAPAFRRAGVTRISLGVQSLHDTTLRRLGRGHAAADARAGLAACLDAGFDSVSVDLIYGAPGQTLAELLEDLDALIASRVGHVSTYALTLEPGTPFATAHAAGRLELPDEDAQLAMTRAVRSELTAAGFEPYEISSFARPGHRSRHNQRYWRRDDVLGLGVSAASLLGDRRTRNSPSRAEWEASLGSGRLPVCEEERLGPEEARREALFLGLRRLEGVSRAGYLRAFREPPERRFRPELDELRQLGLISDSGGFLRLTDQGILFSDEVFLRFVAG